MKSLSVATLITLAGAGAAQAQECGAPKLAGAPVACALRNGALVAETGAGRMELRGRWQALPGGSRFTTRRGFSLVTPAGELPIPAGQVTVDCEAGFALTGELSGMPDFGALLPGATIDTHAPTVAFGMGRGDTLAEMGAPVDPCRTYAYFALDTSVWGGIEEASITPYAGDQALIAVDPFDPGFLISVGGQHVSDATAGFLYSAGLGVSRSGLIPWTSVVDLPTGEGDELAPVTIDAHAYVAAMVGLLPIPKSPVQLYVDGTLVVDLGPWADEAASVVSDLLTAETADVAGLVARRTGAPRADVASQIRIGANAKIITLWIREFAVTLGQASVAVEDGRYSFAAEQWSPGQGFRDRSDPDAPSTGLPALDSVLSHMMISHTAAARGFIDGERFHIELHADLRIGPLEIEGARIVVDSVEGVRVEHEDVDLDLEAFVERLENIFRCDFAEGVAGCSVGGFRVMSARARVVDGDIDMTVRLDLLGLADGQFSLRSRPNGEFVFVLNAGPGAALGPFLAPNFKLTLTEGGVAIDAGLEVLQSGGRLRGRLRRVGREVRFHLAGTIPIGLGGFRPTAVEVTLTNEDGPVHLSVDAEIKPMDMVPGFSPGSLRVRGDIDSGGRYELRGTAELRVFDYDLGVLDLLVSNKPGKQGLTVQGRFDAQAIRVRLNGRAAPGQDLTLAGAADLTTGGHTLLAAGFSLTGREGLVATGQLDLGGLTFGMRGAVSRRGDVALSATSSIDMPILGDLEIIQRGVECGTRTVQSAADCGWQIFNDAFHCGERLVQDATRCGTELVEVAREWVTDAQLCGTRAAQCGTELVQGALQYGENAALCGVDQVECATQYVADGARCGFELVADKVPAMGQCANDWLACAMKNVIGIYCDPVGNPPASCLAFASPKTCPAPVMCDQPRSCNFVGEPYEVPVICDVAETCERVVTAEVPRSCAIVPECTLPGTCDIPNYCDRTHIEPDRNLGRYRGDLTLTLGTTLGARITGSFCDAQSWCSAWSASATIRGEHAGAPELCVGLPSELLPEEAILATFTPDGRPEFCMPL